MRKGGEHREERWGSMQASFQMENVVCGAEKWDV